MTPGVWRGAIGAARAGLLVLSAPLDVLGDHAAGSGGSGNAPIGVALMWGGAAFVVGMLIVAVLARVTRRARPRDEGDPP